MDQVSPRTAAKRPNKPLRGPGASAPKKPNLRVWRNHTSTGGKLLTRLEAENADLRDKAVELLLQIQALRGGDQALTA